MVWYMNDDIIKLFFKKDKREPRYQQQLADPITRQSEITKN